MSITTSIKNKPYRILLQVGATTAAILAVLWKYKRRMGSDASFYNDQGDIEQFIIFLLSSLLLYTPGVLLYAFIYWLMHKFNRPTRPNLNLIHVILLGTSFVIGLAYGAKKIIVDGAYNINNLNTDMFKTTIFDYLLSIIGIMVPIIFLVNIIISLVKPIKDLGTPKVKPDL